MYDIDRVASDMGFLLTDLYRATQKRRRLKVFLCGKEPTNSFHDSRKQIKHLLSTKMGCDPFLGEDIEDLKITVDSDRNHLTIEIAEATESDLVIVFLESMGTVAELTAFAMIPEVNGKVIVFNDRKFENVRSFVSCGPLKWIHKNRVIYYDGGHESPSRELVSRLDLIVAGAWFEKDRAHRLYWTSELSFVDHVTLALINACYPIRFKELSDRLPGCDTDLRDALAKLFTRKEIEERDQAYVPSTSGFLLKNDSAILRDIARVRLNVWNKRLQRQPSTK